MADIYFKKDKVKYGTGHTDVIFKYQHGNHNLDTCRERFIECDINGKAIVKKTSKKGDE